MAHRTDRRRQSAARRNPPAAAELAKRLDLPDEVTTTEAAEILGCCKHTILQYLVEGLLEWRNAAPPSSTRPVYRLTLRSVLELRLGYRRGNPLPPLPVKTSRIRRRSARVSDYQPKHLRRKKPAAQEAN
jgi:hypothetical protein